MTKFTKSSLAIHNNKLQMGLDFAKVDRKRRLVSGFATLDNLDTQNEIVEPEAALDAFRRARGNLREMHQPIAVGKVVDFQEREFYNHEDGKTYKGIFVTARVSEGAEDTWKKVLDGTLSGFSIGGNVVDSYKDMRKDSGGPVEVIKAFDLIELSLVDNPANPLANIENIHKVLSLTDNNGSVTAKGMVAEQIIKNLYYCEEDNLSVSVDIGEVPVCPLCQSTSMEEIGWYEATDSSDAKIQKMVNNFLNVGDAPVEGGADKMKMFKKSRDTKESEVVDAPEDEVSEVIEDDTEVDIAEVLTEVIEKIGEVTEQARAGDAETVRYIEEKFNELNEEIEKRHAVVESRLHELDKTLEAHKTKLNVVEKTLEKINRSGAVRKSAEAITKVASAGETRNDSDWNGAFSLRNV